MGYNPSKFKGPNRPVEGVSWYDCIVFIEKVNAMTPSASLRLPTEAEWEYSCRAGTTTPFNFGENVTYGDKINFDGNYPYISRIKCQKRGETVGVKSFPCNDWGLYEMHGNVEEWCQDWYGDYPEGSVTNPAGPGTRPGRMGNFPGYEKVRRGGYYHSHGEEVRSAARSGLNHNKRIGGVGFRLANNELK